MNNSSLQHSEPSSREEFYSRGTQAVAAGLVVAALVTNFLVIKGSPLPWIGAVAGFLLAIPLPAWMLSQKINWRTEAPSERLGYAVVSALLGLMSVGLIINTVLPFLGISRPLDRGPVLAAVDIWCCALALWRPTRFQPKIPRLGLGQLLGADWAVCLLSALCVPMAIIGANRLNNDAGDGVTLAMLVLAVIVLILMFSKRNELNSGTLTAAIYFISLALLLMTSLRGWYITGHDIQQEYKVFQLTKDKGVWDIAGFRDAYNACLSITILPTMLWQLLRVDDPYIFKFWFQLLFALCPVFVYRISLRHSNRAIAIIAVIYFIAFPTYFNDMPFLNRQEIAFLFVAACVMTATDPSVSSNRVRLRIGILSIGVVLSHYSTSYVFLGTLAISWLTYKTLAAFRRIKERPERPARTYTKKELAKRIAPAVSLANVAVVLFAIGLWNGVATHTVNGLGSTFSQAVHGLLGAADSKSGDVSYSLFGQHTLSASQLLAQYKQSTLTQTGAQRVASGFYPEQVIDKYPVSAVPLANIPVTAAGRSLDSIGLNVSTLNSVMRSGAARLLQIFVVLGLLAAYLSKNRRSRSFTELFALAGAALVIVVLQVVLPAISVDYGVLRAFQQALIVFGPFVTVGSLTILRFLSAKWSFRIAFGIAILFFSSLVGIIPQVLGGYPAQLNLNNSGQYYNIFYTHPQGITAINWLQARISTGPDEKGQPEVQMDNFTYSELQTFTHLRINNNSFPTLLQKNSYVFLGYPTVAKGQATLADAGDLITYTYPVAFLNSTDDLVYSSNGALIYR